VKTVEIGFSSQSNTVHRKVANQLKAAKKSSKYKLHGRRKREGGKYQLRTPHKKGRSRNVAQNAKRTGFKPTMHGGINEREVSSQDQIGQASIPQTRRREPGKRQRLWLPDIVTQSTYTRHSR